MRRPLCLLALAALAAGPAGADTPLFITADVPTTVTVGPTLQPWEIWRYDLPGPVYTLQLVVPGSPHIDAIHKMNDPGDWLLSVETSSNLGGMLATEAQPQDIVRYDGPTGTYSFFFCGGLVGLSTDSNLDAFYLDGNSGPLFLSFDVPTEVPAGSGTFLDPSDLLEFASTGPGCGGWMFTGVAFDASATGAGIPISGNVNGAAARAGSTVLALDVPSALAPSGGPATYVPGQIASWNGAMFNLFEGLIGWPPGSLVEGLSLQASPGRVDPAVVPLKLAKALPDIILYWGASCAGGADDYGIYEGTIASIHGGVYDHVKIDCNDAAPFLEEQVTPSSSSSYYLVVPFNASDEGSYGLATPAVQRPQAAAPADRCSVTQDLTPCP